MAAPVFSYEAHATGTNPTTSWSITLPATAANDIIVLLAVNRDSTTEPTWGGTYTGGAWTTFLSGSSSTPSVWLRWSRATGNHSGETITGTGTGSCVACLMGVTGCITSGSPVDANTNSRWDNASPDVNTLDAFSTTVADTMVVLATGGTDDAPIASTFTKDGGGTAMTLRANDESTGGSDCSVSMAEVAQASAASTGQFNFAQNLGVGDAKWILAFALKPPVVSGDVTVEPDQGSSTFSAEASTVTVTAAPDQATVTAAAEAPTVAIVVAPDQGTVTFGAEAATATETAEPDQGTVTFGAEAPTVAIFEVVEPDQGTVTFSAEAPTVTITVAPDQGTATFDTDAPTVAVVVAPDQGTATFGAEVPVVDAGGAETVAPDQGSVTFDAEAATVAVGVDPDQATATFTADEPTVTLVVEPDQGAVTLGADALEVTVAAATDQAAVTFDADTPTVTIVVAPDQGAVTFAADEATVLAPVEVEADQGAVTFDGYPPDVAVTADTVYEPGMYVDRRSRIGHTRAPARVPRISGRR